MKTHYAPLGWPTTLCGLRADGLNIQLAPSPDMAACLRCSPGNTQADAIRKHAIPALRDAAMKPCHRSNCGTACLCMRCHARKALEVLDPSWRP